MPSVLTELSHWSASLPYWEQAALEKIVGGTTFTDKDYEELLRYLLEDLGLVDRFGDRPKLIFPLEPDVALSPATSIKLIGVCKLENINALVSGQTLLFCPTITAIFGGNGSGKSGYARVLGCAGFTRGDREILPDVTQSVATTKEMTADIVIEDQFGERSIHHKIGKNCPELSSCYVFDSTSVRVHLTESYVLSFSPAGLSYLTKLAEITDEVRRRLRALVAKYKEPRNFSSIFQGESEVSKKVLLLSSETDIEELRQLASLSQEEEDKIIDCETKIARLITQDVSEQIADLARRENDLLLLITRLRELEEGLSDEVVEDIQIKVGVYTHLRNNAQRVSIDQFKSEFFIDTGTDEWYEFIKAAKILSNADRVQDASYPQDGSRCLLCQQPLSPQARDLLSRLWEFLEGEVQSRLLSAQSTLDEKRHAIEEINIDFFDDQSVSCRHLLEYDYVIADKIEKFIIACRERQRLILFAIGNLLETIEVQPLPESVIKEVNGIVESLRMRREELQEKDTATEIFRLQQDLLNIQHRKLLKIYLQEIEAYVSRLQWAMHAEMNVGSTTHITKMYNRLFKQLVTDRYIELFEQTLSDLNRQLKVKVVTKGSKGEVYKQIVVESHSANSGIASPDKVLSEGEKRAVALADFLTEVRLDSTSSAVILDDPVTSLDLEWRGLVATILAKEAKKRQVIVFTHDLPFLYLLKQNCEQENVKISTHWIKRGEYDDKPGYVFLDNSPTLEKEYRKPNRAFDFYERARIATAEEQESLLREGFGALRTSYEAFIIFDILNEVVMRFNERISFGRLKDIVWNSEITQDVIDACERLSRLIEGHLHSDAFGGSKPTPQLLLDEINTFKELRKKLNDLKND